MMERSCGRVSRVGLHVTPLWVVAAVAALMFVSAAIAQDRSFSEYSVKAAFLYILPDFVVWPNSPPHQSTLTLCVLGDDPFGASLGFFEGKRIKNRTLRIVQLSGEASLPDCEILFISKSVTDQTRRILGPIAGSPVLTVGEARGFTRNGGVVALLLVGDQVQLEINVSAARAAGLSISSKLLKMAHVVDFPSVQEPR